MKAREFHCMGVKYIPLQKGDLVPHYWLKDKRNKGWLFTSQRIKQLLKMKRISIENLRLTSSGRLVKASDYTVKGIDLATIKLVRFNDYTDYDPCLCNNGGRYGFWTDYTKTKAGDWEITYHTTAEFTYCPSCGRFGDHIDEDGEYSCGEPQRISDEVLLKRVKNFKESDTTSIEVITRR